LIEEFDGERRSVGEHSAVRSHLIAFSFFRPVDRDDFTGSRCSMEDVTRFPNNNAGSRLVEDNSTIQRQCCDSKAPELLARMMRLIDHFVLFM
jgi:hypothetical protein